MAGGPLGLEVTRTARVLSRAFEDALAAEGGSVATWLVLVSLKATRHGMQRDLAEAVGIVGPTLTHHLNRMEKAGLVTRRRDPQNRRVHHVEMTDAGEELFHRLRRSAEAFDRRLRAGVTEGEVETVRRVLEQLRTNTLTKEQTS